MKRFLSILLVLVVTGITAQTKIYTPALLTPNNAASNQMPDVVLSWSGVTGIGIIKYKLVIDDNATFESPKAFVTEFITSVQMADLNYSTTYYWRVKSYDAATGDSSYWSETRSFTTFSKLDPRKPDNKAKGQAAVVSIEWKDRLGPNLITGNTLFNYVIDTTESFNSPLLKSVEVDGSLFKSLSPKLRFGTNYFWKVRALNNNDTSGWSDLFKFRTLDSLQLDIPANNLVNAQINVKIGWKKVTGATKYDYELSTTPDFNDPLRYATEQTVLIPEGLTFGTKYYWRVRARHESDTTSWGDSRNFTVIEYPKALTPADGAVDVEVQPEFVWTKMTGITNIEVEYADNAAFNGAFSQKTADSSIVSYKCPYILENKTFYYWRLRAWTTTDSSDWSPAWSFKTASGVGIMHNSKANVQVYPNPAKDKMNVRFSSGMVGLITIKIVDLFGQNLLVQQADGVESSVMTIDISKVPNGIYLLKTEGAGKINVQKVIVDR